MSQPGLFTLLLARRFMCSGALARTTLVMVVTSALLFGIFVTLSSLTLSGAQAVERDLGRFGAAVHLGAVEELAVAPGDRDVRRQLVAAGRAAGVNGLAIELISLDVRPTGINPPRTYYSEAPWQSLPFPERFSLRSGRWPARPGEVAVTNAHVVGLRANERLSVLSGRHEFRVVGTVRDRYGRFLSILAAPGTWAALDPSVLDAFPTLAASARVLAPAEHVDALVATLAGSLARRPGAQADSTLRAALLSATTTEDELLHKRERSWVDRIPAAYSVPFFVFPLLATFLVFGLNDRRLRRNLSVLTDLGVGGGQAVAGMALALTAWTLIAALAGAVLGLAVAIAARPILQALHPLPLSPVQGLEGPAVRLLAMTVTGAIASALALRASHGVRRAESGRPRPDRVRRWRDLRHILAVLAACVSVLQVAQLQSAANASVLAATLTLAVLLLAPETLGCALRALPERAARPRLARRQLLADRRRAVIATATLAAVLGLPLGFLTLLDTTFRTLEVDLAPEVLPGQLAVRGLGGTLVPPSPAVASMVRHTLDSSDTAIPLRYLYSDTTFVYVAGTDGGFVLALDTPAQVAALLDRRLPSRATETLRRGGMLVWEGSGRLSSVVLIAEEEGRGPVSTRPLPVVHIAAPVVEWRGGARGILLTETARRLRLPVSDGARFYTGLSDGDVSAARRAVLEAGLDPEQVRGYEPPRSRVPPVALYAAAAGLTLLALLTCLAVARSQAAALRGYLGTLIAIGLSTRWARQVLLIEQAVIMGVATLLAAVIAIPPVLLAVWQLPGYVLGIPWSWLGSVLAVVYLGSFLAILSASRRLRACPLPQS